MKNLYNIILIEALEDSAAKYQKDIDKVQALAKTISSNEDKFKRDFIKYFYQENGERDTNNADTEGSQEDYMKSGSEEVARFLVDYIFKLLGAAPNEKDQSISSYKDHFDIILTTYLSLDFTGFDLTARVRVIPNPKNKPGKKFLFDIDLDEAHLDVMPEDTHDKDFKIPDEPLTYDILAYKDYDYKESKLKGKFQEQIKTFKNKYENSSTNQFIEKTWFTLQGSKDAPKSVEELYKFTETFIKAIVKHLKLKSEGPVESKKDYLNYHSTSVKTNLGTLYVNTNLIGGDYGALVGVQLFYPEGDPIELYKND